VSRPTGAGPVADLDLRVGLTAVRPALSTEGIVNRKADRIYLGSNGSSALRSGGPVLAWG